MCQPTTSAATNQDKSIMVTPYQSYIEMLLPLLGGSIGDSSTEKQPPNSSLSSSVEDTTEIIVKICFDNARLLTDRDSMTMRSRQKQKATTRICRWSSTPDLADASLKVAATANTDNAPRSIEDLRSLMTQNSRPARSSDGLRNLARSSKNAEHESNHLKNDRWYIPSSSSNTSPAANSSLSDRKKSPQTVQKTKSPFDLPMPSLTIPLSTMTAPTTAKKALHQQEQARRAKGSLRKSRSMPEDKTSSRNHHLKIPQRQSSMESDSVLKTMLNRFETTDSES